MRSLLCHLESFDLRAKQSGIRPTPKFHLMGHFVLRTNAMTKYTRVKGGGSEKGNRLGENAGVAVLAGSRNHNPRSPGPRRVEPRPA
eukprot:7684935-Pyramimonas_sp.AAC.1